jgi:hypothetical protein
MERLLVIKLDGVDCEAEALLNGVPLARVNAARPRATVPVHEYTVAGTNRLELVLWPRPATEPEPAAEPPLPRVGDGKRLARLHVLLPRVGAPADEASARSLAQLDWAAPEGQSYEAPLRLAQDVALPVNFPRWRWLDAPLVDITPALRAQALALLQELAQDLAAGQTERYLSVVRLRTEELALAYQRRPEEETPRLRENLLNLHEAGRLVFKPLGAEGPVLRRLAGGRLLECLDADGQPALSTEPDAQGRTLALPLRLAAVDGKLYVLR